MHYILRRIIPLLLALCLLTATVPVCLAVSYMPDVTPEMSDADFWAARASDADAVLMTPEQIAARNAAAIAASGTMLIDLRDAPETFDGPARNEAAASSARSDAEYYSGWIYGPNGEIANWSFFCAMIANSIDPHAYENQPLRFGIAVRRTTLLSFPTEYTLTDDLTDADFDYNALSSVNVNEPLWIYTTSADGRFYLARSSCCSGWVPAEDVALCRDREEWLGAWDIPEDELLVVTEGSVYTAVSRTCPEVSERKLTLGTKLRLVDSASIEGLVNNRTPFHSYVVELPVRGPGGAYRRELALIPETAGVHEGFLPLTQRELARVMLNTLGDAYGWGGMMDVEDCSGLVRQVYACFGLELARNTTWQCSMPAPRVDMQSMSLEEKCALLDALPLGAVLTFNGHEMMYLGRADGHYYAASTVGTLLMPNEPYQRLRVRGVLINTLDTRRANGRTWLQEIYQATLMGCPDDYPLPQPQWYHDAEVFCLERGLLSLNTGSTFCPEDTVSRAQAAEALWRMAGKPEAEDAPFFEDVPENHANAAAIGWAAGSGVMVGFGNGLFGPSQPMTREQIAVVLHRFAAAQGAALAEAGAAPEAYSDWAAVSSFAADAMRWACAAGILRGSGGALTPQGALTRAQLAAVLQQYDGALSAQILSETP